MAAKANSGDLSDVLVEHGGGVFDSLFGPVSKEYCFIFSVAMVVAFVVAVLNLLLCGLVVFGGRRVVGATLAANPLGWVPFFTAFVTNLAAYFIYRLLYTMCIT